MNFRVGLAWVLIGICISSSAQNSSIESLTIADGLSQGMIYDIEQTDDGFLWIATKDGLNRYDGYHFLVFTNDPFNPFSIAGNDITALYEDSHGNLWIAIKGRGCDVLEKSTGRFLHLPAYNENADKFIVNCFEESPDGTIWIGFDGGLLALHWNNNKDSIVKESDLRASASVELVTRGYRPGHEFFHSIHANTDGTLLVSIRDDGIYRYIPSQHFLTFPYKEATARKGRFMGVSMHDRVWALYGKSPTGPVHLMPLQEFSLMQMATCFGPQKLPMRLLFIQYRKPK
jgi:hypothetical protein